MPKLKKLQEGDIICIPIKEKFVLCLVTRISNLKTPLGYFYNGVFDNVPDLSMTLNLEFKNPIYIREFGFQGLKSGKWKIIGRYPNFKREFFPLPRFIRHVPPFKPILVQYDENLNELESTPIKDEDLKKYAGLPETGLGGAGYIEKKLEMLLFNL